MAQKQAPTFVQTIGTICQPVAVSTPRNVLLLRDRTRQRFVRPLQVRAARLKSIVDASAALSDDVEGHGSRTDVAESESELQDSGSRESDQSSEPRATSDQQSYEEGPEAGGGDDDGADGADGADGGDSSGHDGHHDHHHDGERTPKAVFLAAGNTTRHSVEVAWSWFVAAIVRVFNVIPVQILTTLIGLLSGYAAHRRSVEVEKKREAASHEARAKAERDRIEKELRQKYEKMHGPLLKAACKLSERLYVLVSGAETSKWDDGEVPYPSSLYTTYLLGRYLGLVEVMKRQSHQVMDLGYPAADRIFLNILGRIQGVLAAEDASLIRLQETEAYFKPAPGQKPVSGGPFRVSSRNQSALGELMLRRDGMDNRFGDEGTAADAVMTFCEFAKRMEVDPELRKWFNPVTECIEQLQACGHNAKSRAKVKTARRHNVSDAREDGRALIGSRPYFVQCALQDLIDFLDPLPRTKYARPGLRKRLRLGAINQGEEYHMPSSLRKLYGELANVRDHRVRMEDVRGKSRKDHELEVFVKAPDLVDERVDSDSSKRASAIAVLEKSMREGVGRATNDPGDCPFSQRVLIALEEFGLKYKIVPVSVEAKPGWFHLLHPEGQVPVMYHEGYLIAGSRDIMGYLMEQFPDKAKKMSNAQPTTSMPAGTMAFTRFYPRFYDALTGRKGALEEMHQELRILDKTIACAQAANAERARRRRFARSRRGHSGQRKTEHEVGGAFLGGARFAREDTLIAPMLDRVDIAGTALGGPDFGIPEDCKALRRYLREARRKTSFRRTSPAADVTIRGYSKLTYGPERIAWLSDMLE